MATITENTITGSASTGPHSFTFPYIKADDVKVTKTASNGTVTTLTKVDSSPIQDQYTQATTSITLGENTLVATDKLRIYRLTSDTDLTATFYPGSAIRSTDLNDNFTQNLYSTQEVVSRYYDVGGTIPLKGDMDAATNRITNLGEPTDQTDAATKEYVDDQDNLLAGTDLTKTKNDEANTVTIDHDAVGASSVNNSDGTVIQDLTISATGHITNHGSVNLDGRYYTEAELDAGQLDNRYYTESEAHDTFLSIDYSDEVERVYDSILSVDAIGKDLANSFSNVDNYGTLDEVNDPVTSSTGTSYIKTVADSIANVDLVGPSITNVNALAPQAVRDNMAALAPQAVRNNMAILGTADVVDDMAALAPQDVRDDMEDIVNAENLITGTKNLDKVADDIDNVTAVGTYIANVNTIATTTDLIADIATVADDGPDIGNVAAVADQVGRLGTIDTVAKITILGSVDTVVDMSKLGTDACVEDMSKLGTDACVGHMATIADTTDLVANIKLVAEDAEDIGKVAGKDTEIGNLGTSTAVTNLGIVSGISGNVTTVAGISGNVTKVATIDANVTKVAAIDANVTKVADIDTDVTDVADIKTDVTTVAGDINGEENVSTVGRDVGSKIGVKNYQDWETPINHGDLTTHSSTADYNNVTSTVTTKLNYNDHSRIELVFDNITDINTVAGKDTEIGLLGTAAAVADMDLLATTDCIADMDLLGTSACVEDMSLLGTTACIADMDLLATTDCIADMDLLATAAIVEDMSHLGTAACVADMALLGTADVVADLDLLATTDVVADMALLGTAACVADMDILGTADTVADMALLGTTDVVADMALLGTSACVADMAILGTTDVVSDLNTLATADIVSDLDTCATNISNINSASANATAAGTAKGLAETAQSAAELAETNAEAARDIALSYKNSALSYSNSASSTYSSTQGLYTQQASIAYNLGHDVTSHTDWGSVNDVDSVDFAGELAATTLLTMSKGSGTYSYNGSSGNWFD